MTKHLLRTRRCVFQLDDENRTACIISCRPGRCKRYKLPEQVIADGVTYRVVSIEIEGMKWMRTLRHLVIPDSFNYVDEDCMHGLPNLRSVHVGKGVDYLNSWNFRCCPKLRVLTIDKSNPHLRVQDGLLLSADGTVLLRSLFPIKDLQIPDGVKYIEKVAFWYDERLESITFPSSLRQIGDNSFSNLPNLRKLVLPEGLERLVVQCFMDCVNLEWVDLPSTLKSVDLDNFDGCNRLSTLILRSTTVVDSKWGVYDNIPASCRLFVPSALVEAYRQHPVWSRFTNIQEIESLTR